MGDYGGDEQNQSIIDVYMKMSQQKPLHNYHTLIKCFLIQNWYISIFIESLPLNQKIAVQIVVYSIIEYYITMRNLENIKFILRSKTQNIHSMNSFTWTSKTDKLAILFRNVYIACNSIKNCWKWPWNLVVKQQSSLSWAGGVWGVALILGW
jgi:hypothetical protein